MNKNKIRYFAVKQDIESGHNKIYSCLTDVKNMAQAIDEAEAYDCIAIAINEVDADFIQSQF